MSLITRLVLKAWLSTSVEFEPGTFKFRVEASLSYINLFYSLLEIVLLLARAATPLSQAFYFQVIGSNVRILTFKAFTVTLVF